MVQAAPLPEISALVYALPATQDGGNAQITVTLDSIPSPSITGGVFLGTNPSGSGLASGSNDGGATIVIPIDPSLLSPGQTYSVALAVSQSQNWGPATILVFQQPTMTAIEVVGEAVNIRWTVPATANITAVTASIYDTVHDTTLVSATSGSLGITLYPPQPIDPAGNYVVQLVGLNGVASGPMVQSQESLILTAPAIAATVYDTSSITVTAAGGTPPNPIYAQLISGEIVVSEAAASGTTATIALSAPLDAASRWEVALLYRSSIASGPLGVAVVIPLAAPELLSASFNGSSFDVRWTLPANATGASVVVEESGGGTAGSADVQYGTSATFTATVDGTKSYDVRLAPYAGTARGLFGAATPLIVADPALATATSDGAQVVVTMSGLSAPADVTVLQITSGGSVVASAAGGLTAGAIALPQSALPSLAVTAFATGPNVSGPSSSAPIALVTDAPVVTGVSVAGNQATVAWTFSGSATSYQVNLVNGRTETTLGTPGASPATVGLPATVASASGIVVRAVSGNATGPASAAVPLLTSALTIGAPQYDGTTLLVDWSAAADAGILGYTAAIVDASSNVVAATNTPATSAAFDVVLTAGAAYTIQLTAYGAGTTGPMATQTFSVPPATTLSFVTYAADDTLYVNWNALTDASVTGYRVDVFVDFEPAISATVEGGSTNQAQIPAIFAAGAEVSVTVTPLSHGIDGPASAAIEAVTVVPTLTNVFYDGPPGTLSASWSVAGGSAPTYVLAVKQGASIVQSQTFPTTSGSFAVDLPGSGYSVVVWASGPNAYGPSSAGVDPQSGPMGYFFSTDTQNAPYLFRSGGRPPFSSSLTSQDIVIYLPNVFTSDPLAIEPTQKTFVLASASGGQIAYQVSVAAGVVWDFSGSRTQLRSDYLAFLTALEEVMKPGGASFVGRALTLAMPLLFSETLLYRYGFNPQSRYVDLQPGMKLRLDSESYQFTAGGDNDGFTTTASATYDLAGSLITDGNVNVAWDPFLSLLSNVSPGGGTGGMGGIIDLYGTGLTQPYYRLFYPSTFVASNSEGSATAGNVVLLGAASISALETATAALLQGKTPSGVSFFRGRAVVLPRIVVVVNGNPVEVSVGTTLRQLIGSWANLPYAEALQLTGISIERPIPGVIDSATPPLTSLSVAQTNTIDFSNQIVTSYLKGTVDWFDLPLFGGDRITIGGLS